MWTESEVNGQSFHIKVTKNTAQPHQIHRDKALLLVVLKCTEYQHLHFYKTPKFKKNLLVKKREFLN